MLSFSRQCKQKLLNSTSVQGGLIRRMTNNVALTWWFLTKLPTIVSLAAVLVSSQNAPSLGGALRDETKPAVR